MSTMRWIQDGEEYHLYFAPYEKEELVATIFYDEGWCLKGKTPCNWLDSNTLDDAKSEVEDIVESGYADEIGYFTDMLRAFKEARAK